MKYRAKFLQEVTIEVEAEGIQLAEKYAKVMVNPEFKLLSIYPADYVEPTESVEGKKSATLNDGLAKKVRSLLPKDTA